MTELPQETQLERAKRIASEAGLKWEKLDEKTKKTLIFDKACGTGGYSEEDYHDDSSRYWEREGRKRH